VCLLKLYCVSELERQVYRRLLCFDRNLKEGENTKTTLSYVTEYCPKDDEASGGLRKRSRLL